MPSAVKLQNIDTTWLKTFISAYYIGIFATFWNQMIKNLCAYEQESY